jgi:hypothetical protein
LVGAAPSLVRIFVGLSLSLPATQMFAPSASRADAESGGRTCRLQWDNQSMLVSVDHTAAWPRGSGR